VLGGHECGARDTWRCASAPQPLRVKSTAGYWSASEVKLTEPQADEFLCQMGSEVAQNGGPRHRVRAKTYAEDARGLLVPTAAVRRKAPPARTVRQSNFGQC